MIATSLRDAEGAVRERCDNRPAARLEGRAKVGEVGNASGLRPARAGTSPIASVCRSLLPHLPLAERLALIVLSPDPLRGGDHVAQTAVAAWVSHVAHTTSTPMVSVGASGVAWVSGTSRETMTCGLTELRVATKQPQPIPPEPCSFPKVSATRPGLRRCWAGTFRHKSGTR
jgi:hypothetical protein